MSSCHCFRSFCRFLTIFCAVGRDIHLAYAFSTSRRNESKEVRNLIFKFRSQVTTPPDGALQNRRWPSLEIHPPFGGRWADGFGGGLGVDAGGRGLKTSPKAFSNKYIG